MKTRRILFFLFLFFYLSFFLWADLPQINSYGVFRDNRFSDPFLRAYWFGPGGPGEMLVGVRSINLATHQELNTLALYVRTQGGSFELVRIEEAPENRGTPLGQGVDEILPFIELTGSSNPLEESWVQFYGVNDSTSQAYFPILAPMFGFTALYEPGDAEPIYYLERTGSLSQESLGVFFSLEPSQSFSGRSQGLWPILESETVTTDLGRVQIAVDANWQRVPKTRGTLALSYYNDLDAQITVESYRKTAAAAAGVHTIRDFLLATVFRRSGELEYSSYFVREQDQGIRLGAYIQIRPGIWNYQEYRVWEQEDEFLVVNFFSLADPFWVNRRYFRELLDSIRLVDR